MTTNESLIRISPTGVFRALVVVIVVIAVLGFGSQVFSLVTGHGSLYGLIQFLDLYDEQNIGAFFTTTMMLLAAALLAIISVLKREIHCAYSGRWTVLTVGFIYLAVDESSSIHERFYRPAHDLLGEYATGFLHWTWVVPGIIAVLFFGVFFIGFLRHLTTRTRSFFLVAGVLFVGGAIGVEMIEGFYLELYGNGTLAFRVIYTIEETMEMFGIAVFIFALLDYIADNFPSLSFEFRNGPDRRH